MYCVFISKLYNEVVKVVEEFDENSGYDISGGFITKLHYTSMGHDSVVAIGSTKMEQQGKLIDVFCMGVDGDIQDEVDEKVSNFKRIESLIPSIMGRIFDVESKRNGFYRFLTPYEIADIFDMNSKIDLSKYANIKIRSGKWEYIKSLSDTCVSSCGLSCVLADKTGIFITHTCKPNSKEVDEISIFVNKSMIDIQEDNLMTFCYEMSNTKAIGKCYSNVTAVVKEYWNRYIHANYTDNWIMITGTEGGLALTECGDMCGPNDNYDYRLFQYLKYHTPYPYVFSYRITHSGKYLLTVIARTIYMDKHDLDAFLNKIDDVIKEFKYNPSVYAKIDNILHEYFINGNISDDSTSDVE